MRIPGAFLIIALTAAASCALDTTPPVLYGVSVRPEVITVGSSLTVRIIADDDFSGVSTDSAHLTQVRLTPESGGTQFIDVYNFKLIDGATTFEAISRPFTKNDSSGTWRVSYALLFDFANNYKYYHYGTDFVSSFTVVNNQIPDSKAPVFVSVSVRESSVVPGNTVTVRLGAYDTESGVSTTSAHLTQVRLMPEGGGSQFMDVYNFKPLGAGTSTYEAVSQPFSPYSANGGWQVYSVLLFDNIGNSKYYHYGLDYISSFTVVNQVSDSAPPALLSVSVPGGTALAGSPVTVRFAAVDYVSGVSTSPPNNTQARLVPVNNPGIFADAYKVRLAEGTTVYEAMTEPLSVWSTEGEWKVEYVLLYDNAGNYKYYHYGTDYVSTFTVTNPYKDILRPKNKGDVKIVLPQDSGSKGTINPDSGQAIPVSFKGDGAGTYTLKVFNLLGEQVGETITKITTSAEDWFDWIPGNIASGVYVIYVSGPGVSIHKKVPILR